MTDVSLFSSHVKMGWVVPFMIKPEGTCR